MNDVLSEANGSQVHSTFKPRITDTPTHPKSLTHITQTHTHTHPDNNTDISRQTHTHSNTQTVTQINRHKDTNTETDRLTQENTHTHTEKTETSSHTNIKRQDRYTHEPTYPKRHTQSVLV